VRAMVPGRPIFFANCLNPELMPPTRARARVCAAAVEAFHWLPSRGAIQPALQPAVQLVSSRCNGAIIGLPAPAERNHFFPSSRPVSSNARVSPDFNSFPTKRMLPSSSSSAPFRRMFKRRRWKKKSGSHNSREKSPFPGNDSRARANFGESTSKCSPFFLPSGPSYSRVRKF